MQSSGSMVIPIFLLAFVMTLLILGSLFMTYRGRWTQWSMSARGGFLLILAISTGATVSLLMLMADFVVQFVTNDIVVIFAALVVIYGVCSSSSFRRFLKERRSGSG